MSDFYMPPRKKLKWLAVDMDGTLAYSRWKPDQTKSVVGEPIQENIAKLQAAQAQGYNIIMHTSRHWSDYEMLKEWCQVNNVKVDSIICGKLLAAAYIDDKGIPARAASWLP